MSNLIHTLIKNHFVSGSLVVFIGTFIGNIFNFLFNFFMTRNLSVSDYGILASLVSIVLLFTLAFESIIPTIIHFSSQYFARSEIKKVAAFFWKLNKLIIFFGFVIIGIFIIFGVNISHFFKIENNFLIFLVGLIIFVISLSSLNRGILAGKLSFGYISFFQFFSSFLKFLVGMILIFLGLGVTGGILAFLIGYLSSYLFTFFPLRSILRSEKEKVVGIKEILKYAAPSGIAMLGLTFFITTDIILVKHFFTETEAGIYAGMSLLGRIIYFFSAPIVTVLFPLVAQLHTRRQRHSHFFYLSLFLVLTSSVAITIFYYFFPEFSIKVLLKQEEYLVIKSTLWIFGIFMILYSLLSLVTNYYLSIKKTKVFIPVLVGAISQGVLVYFYHSTFQLVVIISIVTTAIPLLCLLVYYWRVHHEVVG